jgi:hypothetical protein
MRSIVKNRMAHKFGNGMILTALG